MEESYQERHYKLMGLQAQVRMLHLEDQLDSNRPWYMIDELEDYYKTVLRRHMFLTTFSVGVS